MDSEPIKICFAVKEVDGTSGKSEKGLWILRSQRNQVLRTQQEKDNVGIRT